MADTQVSQGIFFVQILNTIRFMENIDFEKKSETKALLVEPDQENLEMCGKRIREGKLVSFPTETVYGLGADATNE